MRKGNIHIAFPLLLSVSLAIGMIFGYKLKDNMGDFAPSIGKNDHTQQISELLELIQMKYVDSLSADSLKNKTLHHLLAELDPHSSYLPADKVAMMNEEMEGKFSGIGIQFEIIDDTLSIVSIIENSPAASSSLLPGDQIVAIDGKSIIGKRKSVDEIKKLVRGKKGSSVQLMISRNKKSFSISIQRALIQSGSIEASYFIRPKTGFIRISKFSENTYEEFMLNLEKMKNMGMEQLILDLRDNGGGIMDEAVQIADEFIEGNKEIVSTKGAHVLPQVYTARRPGLFEKGKLVILINEASASASEILAGALQDWSRATIIGRRSFGKGIVQEQFDLSDGSAVRLTVARYYTPVGRNIQKPYKHGMDTIYSNEISQRFKNGELMNADQHIHSKKKFTLQDGRTVYGEEGIYPDIFVPLESEQIAASEHADVIREQVTKLALSFYKKENKKLHKIKSQEEIQNLLNNDAEFNEAISKLNKKIPQINEDYIIKEVKSVLMWILWKKEGYYKKVNETDPMIIKSLEILN